MWFTSKHRELKHFLKVEDHTFSSTFLQLFIKGISPVENVRCMPVVRVLCLCLSLVTSLWIPEVQGGQQASFEKGVDQANTGDGYVGPAGKQGKNKADITWMSSTSPPSASTSLFAFSFACACAASVRFGPAFYGKWDVPSVAACLWFDTAKLGMWV